jgi:hypothetical protein
VATSFRWFQAHVGKVLSNLNIEADIPFMQWENFHRKNHIPNAYLQIPH